MKRPQTVDAFNDLLTPFLNEPDHKVSDKLLEQIVCEFAKPLIEEIISFKLRVRGGTGFAGDERDDASDLGNDVMLRLVKRLREIKTVTPGSPITNLRGYVAIMTYNACDEYLRRKYPQRHSLKNKLRYVLAHQEGLAIWESEDKRWVCGFDAWRLSRKESITRIEALREGLQWSLREKGAGYGSTNPADLLAAIFDWAQSPIELDVVVAIIADYWGVRDQPLQSQALEDNPRGSWSPSVDPRASLDAKIDRQANIQRLWKEICLLPARQRVALLLSARAAEGTSVITLLPRTGVTNMREIAAVLDMPTDQLAALWNQLPLEDSLIAERLGMRRQQVINLRKSARERLARRIAEIDRKK